MAEEPEDPPGERIGSLSPAGFGSKGRLVAKGLCAGNRIRGRYERTIVFGDERGMCDHEALYSFLYPISYYSSFYFFMFHYSAFQN